MDKQAGIPHADLPPGRYLQLTIEDTGMGISPSVLDNILNPYFTTKDKDKGTGLGLAVVHGIVKGHGGAISVNSRVGEGTAFHVILPTTEETGDRKRRQQTHLPRGTEKIVLVDDEEAIVDIGSQMLKFMGYDVTCVVGSLEALETFKQAPERFDLVVTDLSMPTMTGDQLAKEITRIRPALPVILCTGFSEHLDQNSLVALGIRRIIMKPLAMNLLAEAVREVLDGTQAPAG